MLCFVEFVRSSNSEDVATLLSQKADQIIDINEQIENGFSALHVSDCPHKSRILIEHGINTELKSSYVTLIN